MQGNFLALPFPEATFDAAYAPLTLRCHTHRTAAALPPYALRICGFHASVFLTADVPASAPPPHHSYCIEAACHAPTLIELYSQVFKARAAPACALRMCASATLV